MNWLSRILSRQPREPFEGAPVRQALLIRLNGASLPAPIYEEYDLAGFEDQLEIALDGLGELDGNAIGPTETIIYLYGRDAEAMFHAVERILRTHPLAQGATVTIRKGPPGAAPHEIRSLN